MPGVRSRSVQNSLTRNDANLMSLSLENIEKKSPEKILV